MRRRSHSSRLAQKPQRVERAALVALGRYFSHSSRCTQTRQLFGCPENISSRVRLRRVVSRADWVFTCMPSAAGVVHEVG